MCTIICVCLNELSIYWMGPEMKSIAVQLATIYLVIVTSSIVSWIADFDAKGGSSFKFKIVRGSMKLPKVS